MHLRASPDITFECHHEDCNMKRVTELSWHLQQRVNIHFCVKMGWTFDEIKAALQTVYQQTLSDSSIRMWIRQFRAGRDTIVDQKRAAKSKSGRSPRNIRRVENLVAQDRRITIKEIGVRTGLATTTVQRILRKDLRLKKRCSTFVLAVLTDAHKRRRQDICNLFTRLHHQNPRVFRNVITMDESWVYVWDPDKRLHCMEWLRPGEPKAQTPRRTIATAKVMVLTFFDSKGLVYFEFVQCPQTVNQQLFRAVLRRFDAAHRRRRPHSTVRGRRFLHLDNAPAHNVTLTVALIQQLGWTRLPHPAYSPDLAPNDCWLYSRLKKNLRGMRFPSLAAVKKAVEEEIAQITAMEFHHCMLSSWPRRWRRCLEEQSNYFEGR